LIDTYIRTNNSFLVVYSITDRRSFEEIDSKIQRICLVKDIDLNEAAVILVGNKCDLEENRAVSFEEGKERALNYGIPFMEISAKENINVEEVFHLLVSEYDRCVNRNVKEYRNKKNKSSDCNLM